MDKLILKLFTLTRNCLEFVKILNIFSIMLLILYWIQNLTGKPWSWFGIFTPFFDFFLDISANFTSLTIPIWGANFELKYVVALILFLLIYGLFTLLCAGLSIIEELYTNTKKIVEKFELAHYSKSLLKQEDLEQQKIKNYMLYIEGVQRQKKEYSLNNTNIETLNKELLKFLINKIGSCPEKLNNGYLFRFLPIAQIDNVLDVLFKLPESEAPMNYIMCIQVIDSKPEKAMEEIMNIISLKLLNKVIALTNTTCRYQYNASQKYKL